MAKTHANKGRNGGAGGPMLETVEATPVQAPVEKENGHLRPSPISDFKLTDLVLPLPSGLAVALGRVSLGTLIAGGQIPNPLMAAAMYASETGSDLASRIDADGAPRDEAAIAVEQRNLNAVIDIVVVAAVRTPSLVLDQKDETEDSVWVGRLLDADKRSIYLRIFYKLEHLAPFRGGPGRSTA